MNDDDDDDNDNSFLLPPDDEDDEDDEDKELIIDNLADTKILLSPDARIPGRTAPDVRVSYGQPSCFASS